MSTLYDHAFYSRYDEVIERAITSKREIKYQNIDGNTPLHWLAYNNAPLKVIKALTETYRGLLQIKNDDGNTPLDVAVTNNASQISINYMTETRHNERMKTFDDFVLLQCSLEDLTEENKKLTSMLIRVTNICNKHENEILTLKMGNSQGAFMSKKCTECLEERLDRLEKTALKPKDNLKLDGEIQEINAFAQRKKEIKMKQDMALKQKSSLKSSDEMKSLKKQLTEKIISSQQDQETSRLSKDNRFLQHEISTLKNERLVLLKYKDGKHFEFNALKDENDIMKVRLDTLELNMMEFQSGIDLIRSTMKDGRRMKVSMVESNLEIRNKSSCVKKNPMEDAKGSDDHGKILEKTFQQKEALQKEVSYWKAERVLLLNFRHASNLERQKMWMAIKKVGKEQKKSKENFEKLTMDIQKNETRRTRDVKSDAISHHILANDLNHDEVDSWYTKNEKKMTTSCDYDRDLNIKSISCGAVQLGLQLKKKPRTTLSSIDEDGNISRNLSIQYEKLKRQHANMFQSGHIEERSVCSELSSQSGMNCSRAEWSSSISVMSEDLSKAATRSVSTTLGHAANRKIQQLAIGADDTTFSQTPIASKGINDVEGFEPYHMSKLQIELEKLGQVAVHNPYSEVCSVEAEERNVRSKFRLLSEVESIRSSTTEESQNLPIKNNPSKRLKKKRRLKSIRRLLSSH